MKRFVSRAVHNATKTSSGVQARALSQVQAPPILQDIEHAHLTIDKTSSPKTKYTDKTKLVFGATFTDHMLEIDWDNTDGWHAPKIRPFGDLTIPPGSTALHYGLQAFEGMKAFKGTNDGKTRLFRPDMNLKRLQSSHEFLFFPSFEEKELLECIKDVIRIDEDWIPDGEGFSLYIRPTSISTQPTLGVGPANNIKVYVLLSPVGPYYPTGFAPVNLLADPDIVRAWPHGAGKYKVGGNYAPGIGPAQKAAKQGFQQVLWLFGEDHEITEVGTMNQFFLWEKKDGSGKELVTSPLSSGMILPGVTRDSVLKLAREMPDLEVNERPYYMNEVVEAVEEGRMIEAFGTGTAALISPVKNISFKGKDYNIPLSQGVIGDLAQVFWKNLTDIQYGRVEHEWGVTI